MNLSNIKYKDIFFGMDKDIEKIVFEQEKQEDNEDCDIGIVFGGISMMPYRIEKAKELYEKGQIKKIMLSGGIGYLNSDRKIPEALKLNEYLQAKGVSKKDILIENKSRNTLENVKYSLEILKEKYNLNKTKLMLITSDFHLKRCLSLTSKYIKNDNLYGNGVKDGKIDLNNWKKSLYGRKIILTEALLLCYYAKNNLINDIDIKNYAKK